MAPEKKAAASRLIGKSKLSKPESSKELNFIKTKESNGKSDISMK